MSRPQDLDKCIKDGLGLRWAFMGPFETIELNAPGGIPDYCARFGAGWENMSKAEPGTYAGKNLDAVMSQWQPIAGRRRHGGEDQVAQPPPCRARRAQEGLSRRSTFISCGLAIRTDSPHPEDATAGRVSKDEGP